MEKTSVIRAVRTGGSRWAEGVRHLLWPESCAACGAAITRQDEGLCGPCWQEVSKAAAADYCRSCGREVSPFGIVQGRCGFCRDLSFAYDGMARVGAYENAFRALILSLKFREQTEWADYLGSLLNQAVLSASLASQIDYVVPVPLHWRRRLSRGFNQSHLLAKKLSLPHATIRTDIVRVRYTQQQWDLTPAQRRRNVKGAFAVRKAHPFRGKNILLVDDITTSGATLEECAKVLKEAGAAKVFAAVLATAYHELA
ncbi:MAG: ComF family protein [Planctomycetaceae bacterium]|nr:ComF family protein [Planctomycetaceae bacterium]